MTSNLNLSSYPQFVKKKKIDYNLKTMGKKKRKIPSWLQSILWSVAVEHLDLERDKAYIIHQILAYGDFEELRWLFKTYPKETIKKVFLKKPNKVYTKQSLNFVKEILLDLSNKKLDPYKYDQSLPRIIRS